MTRRPLVFLLVVALIALAPEVAVPQETDLLPKWAPGRIQNSAAELTTQTPGCTASLDVMTNGNPNCPPDQQYFDTDTCQFVCLSTQTPPLRAPTTQKSVVP